MNKKIFSLSFFTSMLVLLISFVLIFGVLYESFQAQLIGELKNEASYISHAVEVEGSTYLDSFTESDKRITLVASDGKVIFDTSADAESLDNHSDREEIKEALKDGQGYSSRYSNTLMEKTVYYAVKMNDGNILRVSATQNSVIVILLGLMQPLIVIIIIALIVSAFLSHRVSKAIIKPINSLDLENPANNEAYEELTPLLSKIAMQKRTIDAQIKEAERKQEEFKLITENMSEGLLVIDSKSNLLTYNKAALRLLEIDNPVSGNILTLNRTKGFREVIEKALKGERAESEITVDEHFYNLIATPAYEENRIIGAVIVIIDITESKKREQLRREFTSNVSHELKTPLTSISGFAEIMKQGGMSNETVMDFSSSIYDEAKRLISLVGDIMKISELDENKVSAEWENTDLFETAKDVAKRLKPEADKKNIAINVIGDTANIWGVKKILDEIIYNLCDNAVKYNKDGGTVDIIINNTEKNAVLTVRDTGIGIPQSDLDRVFERFYRVDKSHSKLIGGTGLGLSIVKHGVLYLNGSIAIDSTEGKGTSITVTFNKAI